MSPLAVVSPRDGLPGPEAPCHLRRRRPRAAELHQATKLFELLPQRPNELWQADVTYIEIPGHGWWHAVT